MSDQQHNNPKRVNPREAEAVLEGEAGRTPPSFLRKQVELAKKEVAAWPEWMKRQAHFEGTNWD